MFGVQKRIIVGFVFAAVLVIAGLTVYFIFPTIQRQRITQMMVLSEKNAILTLWRDLPVPISFEIYLFNVTNADDVQKNGAKPRLKEVGPYKFREKRQKYNVTWNSNYTVSYRQVVQWFYVDGNLDDNITTINVPLLTAGTKLKHAEGFGGLVVKILLGKSQLFVTRTAGELLFEGYPDELLNMASKMNVLPIKTNKFGWFLLKNNTDNGLFNVFTGEHDIHKFTVIDKWNSLSNTTFYDAPCSKIEGTAGELWPPFQYGDNVTLFITDVCRSLKLEFEKERIMEHLNVRKYVANERIFDTGTFDEKNKCFCKDNCLPRGAIDVSICNHGSPVVISMPHFTMADPVYLENVEGLTPDTKKYPAYLYIQPEMGIPVTGSSKFQINVLVQPNKKLTHLKKINKTLVLPVLWFNETATLTPKIIHKLQHSTQHLPYYLKLGSITLIAAGAVVLIILLICLRNKKQNGGWCAFNKKTVQYPAVHFAKIGNGENQQEKQHIEKETSINC